MIPADWRLSVPAGVDDPTTRALVQLAEERLGGVPIERVLVWHTDTVVEAALAHLAELLDIDMATHGVEQTRVLLEQAVDRLRRRGTPSAVEETLEALGLAGAVTEEDTELFRDGSIVRDGSHVHGYDGQWAVFWVKVEGTTAPVSYDTIARQVARTKRKVAHLGAVYAYADMGGADVLATETGEALAFDDGSVLAIEVEKEVALDAGDGAALDAGDGAALAVVALGAPRLVGWHRSGVSAFALATDELSVITTENGEPLIMLEAS